MNTLANDLKDAVYESVVAILVLKGIEEKICSRVANDVVKLFERRFVLKHEEAMVQEAVATVKNAIIEADKKYLSGLNDSTS